MANGFGSFYVGNSGLINAQNALNTTANNMANVNTTGYVRQQVRFSEWTGCIGIGRGTRQGYFLR